MEEISLSQIDGFRVGHAENLAAGTGCTAILCPDGVTASAYTPGFAPGSREMELLKPENSAPLIHGLLLTGGSAFGLAAAAGVVRYLQNMGVGHETGLIKVPLVPAAVIFDYPGNKSNGTLPDYDLGYQAALAANQNPLKSGPFGAGLSARSGLAAGPDLASPSGLGSAGLVEDDCQLAVLAVVNPLGSIVDPHSGQIISGLRRPDGRLAERAEIMAVLKRSDQHPGPAETGHTVLAALGTNARLSKLDAYRLARMAGTGLARSIYPAHLLYDGDTVFALSSNRGPEVNLNWLGALASEMVSRAVVNSALALKEKHV